MRIGDIEYTRRSILLTDTAGESETNDIDFAIGIKVRPLLTRVQVFWTTAQAATGVMEAYLENGAEVTPNRSAGVLESDNRLLPIHIFDQALATNGMGSTFPFESMWWKILMPTIRLHIVSSVLAAAEALITLHYRFATLTDDEIIEIAAQRSQG